MAQAMDVLTPLIQAVKDASNDDAYCKAISALTSQLSASTRYDAAKMIAEPTLKMLASKPSEARTIWACHLLHSLSYSCEKSKTHIGKDLSGIPILLRCLTLPSFEARQQSAAALTSLVSGALKCRSLFQNNRGVEIAFNSFREVPPSSKAKNDLILLLCAVSRTGAMAKQLIELHSLPLFMEIAKSSDNTLQLRDSAANVIAGMAADSNLLPALMEAGVLTFCFDLLKTDPLPETDNPDTPILADRPLEILAHISLEPHLAKIDVSYAIMIARRARQLSARDSTTLSKADKALSQLLNNSTHHFRQDELYRMKMETADPDAMLASKPAAPSKHSPLIAKLIKGMSDTDAAKALESARKLLELMVDEGLAVKREVLAHDDVFGKIWKFVRQCALTWDDKFVHKIADSKVKLKEELGTGAFATVYKGYLKKDKSTPVAIKMIDEANVNLPDLWSEIATLSLLSGLVDNMVQYHAYYYASVTHKINTIKKTTNCHCIVMEYMDTNLETLLHVENAPLKVSEVRRIAFDIAYAMYQLHSYGVLHRDLKPANVLLKKRKDLPYLVKLADFGYARRDSTESLKKSVVGTPAYLPPELIGGTKSDEVGTPGDVYAYGVILWELLTRKKPHDGLEQNNMFAQLYKSKETNTPVFVAPPESDRAIGEIVAVCTHPNPKKRPTFATIHSLLTTLMKETGQ